MLTLSRQTASIVLLALAALLLLLVHEVRFSPRHHSVIVRFFDIGQGDSAFVTGPSGQQILIDGGPDLRTLEHLGKSMPFFDRTIDILVLSHPHLDHVAAFPEILRRYKVGQVIISGAAYENGPYEEFLTLVTEKKIPVIIPEQGRQIDLGDDLLMDLLWPPPVYVGETVDEIHDSNVVFKLRYGNDSVLFTGDAEESVERQLLSQGTDVSATVLKAGHHGSRTSTGTGFLIAVDPEMAVVSVAAKNSYGLPDEDVLGRFTHLGIPYQTTMSGTIVWRMDGKEGL